MSSYCIYFAQVISKLSACLMETMDQDQETMDQDQETMDQDQVNL